MCYLKWLLRYIMKVLQGVSYPIIGRNNWNNRTKENVLGGGDFTPLKQICILKCVAEFLFSTGRVMEL